MNEKHCIFLSKSFTSYRSIACHTCGRSPLTKSDPISLDTVSTTMTGAKEVDDGSEKAEADSWQ